MASSRSHENITCRAGHLLFRNLNNERFIGVRQAAHSGIEAEIFTHIEGHHNLEVFIG